MRNFDDKRTERRANEEARTFQLGGREFVVRPGVRPEDLEGFDQLQELGPHAPISASMRLIDEVFTTLVADRDGAHDAYRQLRADADDPITLEDLRDVMEWMMGVVTGRDGEDGRLPTGQGSGSTPGPAPTPTPLTAVSSSPDTPKASTG